MLERSYNFLTTGLQVTWNKQELKKKADRFEDVIRLVMHGLPYDLVWNTTRNQQQMLWEIIQRDQKDKFEFSNTSTMVGVAKALGGGVKT